MQDFTLLELLEEVVHALARVLPGVEHLFHHLLDHFIFLSDQRRLTLKLSFKLLVALYLLIQLFLQMNLFFI